MTEKNKSIREKFSNEIYAKTMKYQKKFGFEVGTRPDHKAWNNDADAFKHAFMQAVLSLRTNDTFSHMLGTGHEIEGELSNQPKGEKNMDLWNNLIGREIAKEVKQEIKGKENFFTKEQIEDMAAVKIMERMKQGDLITNPNDKRSYEKLKKGNPTGYAVPVQNEPFTAEQISKMTSEEFAQNEQVIMEQLRNGQIKSEQPKDYSSFKNPETGTKKIYTREDIAKMSTDDYSKNEKEILAQMNSIGIPYKNDLPQGTQTHSDTKEKSSAGAQSKSNSTSRNSGEGKWVTINGNHVLIEK